jgi:hypothetical protein
LSLVHVTIFWWVIPWIITPIGVIPKSFRRIHDDDDDDDDDDSGNENNSVDASSTEALDAAIAGRESVASFLSLMGGEEKEGGIVGQEAAT